jgi:hypothetical protein
MLEVRPSVAECIGIRSEVFLKAIHGWIEELFPEAIK